MPQSPEVREGVENGPGAPLDVDHGDEAIAVLKLVIARVPGIGSVVPHHPQMILRNVHRELLLGGNLALPEVGLLDRLTVDGQQALEEAIARAVDTLPLGSASGLGVWAASALEKAVGALGLQPAELDALKPVVVNSAHVVGAEDGSFSARLLAVKARMIATPLSSADLFSSVITSTEVAALDSLASFDGIIEIASIRLWEEGGPSIPITIVLPQAAKDATAEFISSLADSVRALYAQVTGVRTWG